MRKLTKMIFSMLLGIFVFGIITAGSTNTLKAYSKTVSNVRWGTEAGKEYYLYWDKVSGADNYLINIYCYVNDEPVCHVSTSDSGEDGYFDVKAAVRNYYYCEVGQTKPVYTVKACVAAFYGDTRLADHSPFVTKGNLSYDLIGNPENVTVNGDIISWDAVDGAKNYRVALFEENSGPLSMIPVPDNESTYVKGTSASLSEIGLKMEEGKRLVAAVWSVADNNHAEYKQKSNTDDSKIGRSTPSFSAPFTFSFAKLKNFKLVNKHYVVYAEWDALSYADEYAVWIYKADKFGNRTDEGTLISRNSANKVDLSSVFLNEDKSYPDGNYIVAVTAMKNKKACSKETTVLYGKGHGILTNFPTGTKVYKLKGTADTLKFCAYDTCHGGLIDYSQGVKYKLYEQTGDTVKELKQGFTLTNVNINGVTEVSEQQLTFTPSTMSAGTHTYYVTAQYFMLANHGDKEIVSNKVTIVVYDDFDVDGKTADFEESQTIYTSYKKPCVDALVNGTGVTCKKSTIQKAGSQTIEDLPFTRNNERFWSDLTGLEVGSYTIKYEFADVRNSKITKTINLTVKGPGSEKTPLKPVNISINGKYKRVGLTVFFENNKLVAGYEWNYGYPYGEKTPTEGVVTFGWKIFKLNAEGLFATSLGEVGVTGNELTLDELKAFLNSKGENDTKIGLMIYVYNTVEGVETPGTGLQTFSVDLTPHTHSYTYSISCHNGNTHYCYCQCGAYVEENHDSEIKNYDAGYHYSGCTKCDKALVKTAHKWKTAADGYTLECDCGYAHTHTLTKVQAKAATTSADGISKSYWNCTSCKKSYADNSGKADIKKEINPSSYAVARIKDATLSKTSFEYTGKGLKPTVTVKDRNGKTVSSSSYTVKMYDSKGKEVKPVNVGKYSVKIIMKGNYSGTIKKSFTIVPKSMRISSLTNAKGKKMVVKWTRNKQASKYEIQYSTRSDFKNSKTVTATNTKASTQSKTISGLTKGKTYYVRIRAYTVDGKTKLYSAWSSKKKVKISK